MGTLTIAIHPLQDFGGKAEGPTEEAAITINSVTITTYSSAEDNGLDTVG